VIQFQDRARRAAVIDVGSNSVRLVVFEGAMRAPRAVFNEKAMCGLGRDIGRTGKLSVEGRAQALLAMRRFAILVDSMKVDFIDAVATAAVRDAEDGSEFLREVEQVTGIVTRTITGREEAGLSAAGVLAALPEAEGLVGDLGGGSLELVRIGQQGVGSGITLPLGVLRLMDGGVPLANAADIIARQLEGQDVLRDLEGRQLYVVGGTWRALGRLQIELDDHPLDILHGYQVAAADLLQLCRLVAGQSTESLRRFRSVSAARLPALPIAARLLEEVLSRSRISSVKFSSYGLREGLLYERLDAATRACDPLLAACRDIANMYSRMPMDSDVLNEWLMPLFANDSAGLQRLRHAATLLSEISWRVHPDYRARHAMEDVIRGQYVGLDHRERIMLGLALHARYSHKNIADAGAPYRAVIDEQDILWAYRVGLGLRLAHSLSGGVPELLLKFQLETKGGNMILRNLPGAPEPNESVISGRFHNLAKAFGLSPIVIPTS
jgi:exopolyphosphatase/guanosine-5'-triphosphate,3'-diphosphate pyrophosphatase